MQSFALLLLVAALSHAAVVPREQLQAAADLQRGEADLQQTTQPSYGIYLPGSCPPLSTVKTFNLTAYTGRWFEITKMPMVFELGQDCVTADYQKLNESSISVVNSGQIIYTKKRTTVKGMAITTNIPGRLDLHLALPYPLPGFEGEYDVVDTDYENYAVVYSCKQVVPKHYMVQNAWVLSRKPQLADEYLAKASKALDPFKIDPKFFMKTTQDERCIYS